MNSMTQTAPPGMFATAPAAVSAIDRFGFTLFFATALHAITILGITFTLNNDKPVETTIEVTLAQRPQEIEPEKADFIAQANQQGSGLSEQKRAPATTEEADFSANKINPLAQQQPIASPTPVEDTRVTPAPQPEQQAGEQHQPQAIQQKVVTTTKAVEKKTLTQSAKQEQAATPVNAGATTSLLARSLEIASLQAQIERHREEMSRQPRVRRLTSASTRQQDDALYLDNWRRKIEHVGNLNYPEEARRNKMYGSLRLLVAIKPDGSVQNIEILETSGYPVLDDAAIRIVRLAAPFQPFPIEIRKNTDLLEIIRTWKFEKKAYIY